MTCENSEVNYIIELNITFSPKDKALSLLNESSNSVTLSNQAARLLLEMVTNPDTLLNREELIKKVWADYGFTSSNNSLNVAISEIRKAFSSLGTTPQIISTIPKTGFRFEGRVEPAIKIREETGHDESLHLKDKTGGINKKKKLRHTTFIILGVILFLVTIFALYNSNTRSSLKLKNELIKLIYTDSNCTIYNMDIDNKNIDIKKVESAIADIIKSCDMEKIDVYYKKMHPNIANSTTFIGFCTLEKDEYKSCLTFRKNTGH